MENLQVEKIYQHQMTLDEAIAHPFVQKYCALIYTTVSHTEEWNRFRLIWPLPEFVENIDTYEAMVRLLLEQLPHDPACKDGVRVFYGNTRAEFPFVNRDNHLPADWLDRANALAEEEKVARQAQLAQLAAKREQFQQLTEEEGWDIDELIRQALSCIPPRTPGSGNYDESCRVLMALVDHYGPIEGQAIAESWSPSIPGNTWNIAQKVRSFRRSGITLGTLFKIAQGHGFKFPERKKTEWKDPQEPDPISYAQTIQAQREEEKIEVAIRKQGRFDLIKKVAAKLSPKRRLVKIGRPKKEQEPEGRGQKKGIQYTPGCLPMPGTVLTEPIKYRPEELSQLVLEARAKGWKFSLDKSRAGSGKSHGWMALTPAEVGIYQDEDEGRAIYWEFDRNHRNPTTLPGETNFKDMPVRNAGFVQDHTRPTPLGNPHLRHPKKDETPNTTGNCEMAQYFHLASEKWYRPASETAKSNPICRGCQHSVYCGRSSGPNFGYLYERKDVFAHSVQIRSSIESAPPPEDWDYSRDVAAFDEALQQLQPDSATHIGIDDYNAQWNELEEVLPDQFDILAPARRTCRELVAGGAGTYDNGEDAVIREKLGKPPEGLDIDLIYNELTPNISDSVSGLENLESLDETGEAIAKLKGKLQRRESKLAKLQAELKPLEATQKQLLTAANQIRLRGKTVLEDRPKEARKKLERIEVLREEIPTLTTEIESLKLELEQVQLTHSTAKGRNQQTRRDVKTSLKDSIERMSKQWLVSFLNVWTGREQGTLRIGPKGGLTITIANYRQSEIINSLGFAAFLDATATPQLLSLHAGIPIDQILWIEMEMPETDNLKGIQVGGYGQAGKGRAASTDDNLKTLINWTRQKHDKVAVFDHYDKRNVLEADGWHFGNDVRGSNRFQDYDAIVIIGLPRPNLGVLKDRWLTLGGEATGMAFENYYQSFVDAELIQESERLRAIRRLNEQLTVYLVAESERYSPPSEIFTEYVDVADLCPAAADNSAQTWMAIKEVMRVWWTEKGELPTQEAIAAEVGCLQGWVSKLAAQFAAGWKTFKKIFHTLIDPITREWNIFEKPLQESEIPSLADGAETLPEGDDGEIKEPEAWFALGFLPLLAKMPSLEVARELNSILEAFGWEGFKRIVSKAPYRVRLDLVASLFRSVSVEVLVT